jgi:hypothetical protein
MTYVILSGSHVLEAQRQHYVDALAQLIALSHHSGKYNPLHINPNIGIRWAFHPKVAEGEGL